MGVLACICMRVHFLMVSVCMHMHGYMKAILYCVPVLENACLCMCVGVLLVNVYHICLSNAC